MSNCCTVLDGATPKLGVRFTVAICHLSGGKLMRFVGDPHAAEDVTSEVMLALLQNIQNLESEVPKLGGWLRTVVRCKAADYQRALFGPGQRWPSRRISWQPTMSIRNSLRRRHWRWSKQRTGFIGALDTLPERQRIVLEWKYLEALSVREIAERLGETEKAVEVGVVSGAAGVSPIIRFAAIARSGVDQERGSCCGGAKHTLELFEFMGTDAEHLDDGEERPGGVAPGVRPRCAGDAPRIRRRFESAIGC